MVLSPGRRDRRPRPCVPVKCSDTLVRRSGIRTPRVWCRDGQRGPRRRDRPSSSTCRPASDASRPVWSHGKGPRPSEARIPGPTSGHSSGGVTGGSLFWWARRVPLGPGLQWWSWGFRVGHVNGTELTPGLRSGPVVATGTSPTARETTTGVSRTSGPSGVSRLSTGSDVYSTGVGRRVPVPGSPSPPANSGPHRVSSRTVGSVVGSWDGIKLRRLPVNARVTEGSPVLVEELSDRDLVLGDQGALGGGPTLLPVGHRYSPGVGGGRGVDWGTPMTDPPSSEGVPVGPGPCMVRVVVVARGGVRQSPPGSLTACVFDVLSLTARLLWTLCLQW